MQQWSVPVGKEDITDQQKIFRDSIGQKATVQRETMSTEASFRCAQQLVGLGLFVQKEPEFRLKNMDYRGSAAIHIYTNEILNLIQFVPQVQPLFAAKCPQDLASKGIDDLIRALKEGYGHRVGRLRSGF